MRTSASAPLNAQRPHFRTTPSPIVLQRHAPSALRRHLLRSLARVLALLVADTAALLTLRFAIRGFRDGAWAGHGLANALSWLVPKGTYPSPELFVAVLVGLVVYGTYRQGDSRRDAGRVFGGGVLGFALIFWGRVWPDFHPSVILGFALTATVGGLVLIIDRLIVDEIVRRMLPATRARALLVGSSASARETLRSRVFRQRNDIEVVGYLTTDAFPDRNALGSVDSLVETIRAERIDTVIVSSAVDDDSFAAVVDVGTSGGCEVFSLPRVVKGGMVRPQLVWRQGIPLVQLSRPSLRGQQLAVKRVFDIIGAALLLALVAPLFLLIAIAIRLDSAGPVFFVQERVGLGGRRFRMLKFRTMSADADARKRELAHLNHTGDPRLFKIPNDPRITRVGRLLRKWSLDELPQFINVLLGDMSLVGPRPFFEADLSSYEERHFRRLGAKPGITGLWQVTGRSSLIDFEEVVRLDRQYIDQWTPWLDFKILAMTLPAVVRRTGAF